MKRSLMFFAMIAMMLCSTLAYGSTDGTFIQSWLLCGPFPNPAHEGAEVVDGHPPVYDHTPPCVGLDTDYLLEHGGESEIVPVADMTHTKKDGSKVEWFEHTSPVSKIIFRKAITKTPKVVAYAYGEIAAPKAGRYLLALGSDEGVAVWVNGKRVHYKLLKRAIVEDDDLVPVTLKKGQNRILIKVEQGQGGWGFVLRVLSADNLISAVETDVERLAITVSFRKCALEEDEKFELKANGRTIASGVIPGQKTAAFSDVTLKVPFPPVGAEYSALDVVVEGRTIDSISMPSLSNIRNCAFREQTPKGDPGTLFAGETLPALAYENPAWIANLIGPYSLSVDYYDAEYKLVTKAEKPGRYGAIVEVNTATRTFRRFVDLYRQKSGVAPSPDLRESAWWFPLKSKLYGAVDIQVMTFNIRNGKAQDGENRWDLRKAFVCDVIRDDAPDVLGVQEAYRFQLDAFNERLPDYGEVGIGRDGGSEGEHSSILYLKQRFDVDESGTFWLSDTPMKPSASWGNRYRRICTWARLIDKTSARSLYVYNTHLDHQSQPARENGAQLIMKRIAERTHEDPFILMGDFNASEDNSVIAYLKGTGNLADEPRIPLIDSWRVLHPAEKIACTSSWFTGRLDGGKIDYIFITPDTHVSEAAIVRTDRDGRYPSDHYPVTATLSLIQNPSVMAGQTER
jgi:endonuclease/exonuclease/phosphatase family metal-dependent hydrolase